MQQLQRLLAFISYCIVCMTVPLKSLRLISYMQGLQSKLINVYVKCDTYDGSDDHDDDSNPSKHFNGGSTLFLG